MRQALLEHFHEPEGLVLANPRTRTGATIKYTNIFILCFVSIHAHARGATVTNKLLKTIRATAVHTKRLC